MSIETKDCPAKLFKINTINLERFCDFAHIIVKNFYSGERRARVNTCHRLRGIQTNSKWQESLGQAGSCKRIGRIGVKGETSRNSGMSVTLYGASRRNLDARPVLRF